MAASIPGRNRAVFMLTYEELLQRRLGRYQHLTSLRPRQLVSRLTLDITIVHHSPITQLEVLPLRTGRRASGRRTPEDPRCPATNHSSGFSRRASAAGYHGDQEGEEHVQDHLQSQHRPAGQDRHRRGAGGLHRPLRRPERHGHRGHPGVPRREAFCLSLASFPFPVLRLRF